MGSNLLIRYLRIVSLVSIIHKYLPLVSHKIYSNTAFITICTMILADSVLFVVEIIKI